MTNDPLWQVLQQAHAQAVDGKGKERHGSNLPFEQQPIMAIQRMLEGSPIDGHLFQVMKKAQEAGRMAKRGDGEAATRELYGVIVYAAAAAMMVKENEQRPPVETLIRRGHTLTTMEIRKRQEDADHAINEALERARHEVAWPPGSGDEAYQERKAAIDRAGEMLRAGEFKPVDDGPATIYAAQQKAIDRVSALTGSRLQEHEIDHNVLREQMRKQREEDSNG